MVYRKAQWLFPVAIALHNGEEAIWMPGWAARHSLQLPVHPPDAVSLRAALLVLTLAAFAITYLSYRRGPRSFGAYLLFGSIVTALLNVFVPHVPATLAFRSYTPGVVTAVAINFPVMVYLSLRAVRERWVLGWKAATFALVVPAVVGVMILEILDHGKIF